MLLAKYYAKLFLKMTKSSSQESIEDNTEILVARNVLCVEQSTDRALL